MKNETLALLGAVVCAALAACATTTDEGAAIALREKVGALFGTVKPVARQEVETAQAILGRALFWDTRLSFDGKTACASCHPAADWSSDRRPRSINAKGQPTTLHSQPMFMAQDQFALRWYGDRNDGANQAERSMTGSMGFAKAEDMLPLIKSFGYGAAFAAAFPESGGEAAVTVGNYGRAIAAYERTLRTPSGFDAFLAGDNHALDKHQLRGLQTFVDYGCVGCHNGPLLGGNSFRKFGVVKDYWLATGSKDIDNGRFTVTRKDEDKYVYRVPMLRNIAKTAPYFHDASVATLEEAIRVMAEVQLGRAAPPEDIAAIAAFLGALTGEVPAHYAPPPTLAAR